MISEPRPQPGFDLSDRTSLYEPTFLARYSATLQYRPVGFYDMAPIKDQIRGVCALWPYNSYVVDADTRTLCVNGGVKLEVSHYLGNSPAVPVWWRRMRQNFGNGREDPTTNGWIIGLQAGDSAALLHVSACGRFWVFKRSR